MCMLGCVFYVVLCRVCIEMYSLDSVLWIVCSLDVCQVNVVFCVYSMPYVNLGVCCVLVHVCLYNMVYMYLSVYSVCAVNW